MKHRIIYPLAVLAILLSGFLPAVTGYHTDGTYQNLQGENIQLSRYEGKPLMIEAIQTTCGHCRDSGHRQRMNELSSEYTGQVNFLMLTVSGADDKEDMEEFMSTFSISWAAGFDKNDVMSSEFSVTGTPTTILLDADGRYQNKWVGHHEIQSYINSLNELLGEERTIEDTFSPGGVSEPSIIENLFTNPLFQGALIISTLLFIYTKSTSAAPVEVDKKKKTS